MVRTPLGLKLAASRSETNRMRVSTSTSAFCRSRKISCRPLTLIP